MTRRYSSSNAGPLGAPRTSERHGVAAKVIATVDDLDRIAGDDNADVAALKGWRRELFGEKALDLKHGKLFLSIQRGRVVTTEAQ